MGVQGLWQLLDSLGRPVTLESLENKILAVDVSIWIHQAIRGAREGQSTSSTQNAHLLTLFNRICKLLHFRIKPVFVFDGGVPILKKQTMASRRQRKDFASKQSRNISQKLLMNYIRKRVVEKTLLGKVDRKPIPSSKIGSPSKIGSSPSKKNIKKPDLYELPPLPSSFHDTENEDMEQESDSERSNFVEHQLQTNFQDLDSLNLDCEAFQSLPVEIRHEILTECKDLRKKNSWALLDDMPQESQDFSKFQMSRLLKRRNLQQHLEKTEKEMAAFSCGQASAAWNDEYQDVNYGNVAKRIMSEDTAHYILIQGLSKKEPKVLVDDTKDVNDSELSKQQPSTSKVLESDRPSSPLLKRDDNDSDNEPGDCDILAHYQKLVNNATSSSSTITNSEKKTPSIDLTTDNAKWESDSCTLAYDAVQFVDDSKTQDVFNETRTRPIISPGKAKSVVSVNKHPLSEPSAEKHFHALDCESSALNDLQCNESNVDLDKRSIHNEKSMPSSSSPVELIPSEMELGLNEPFRDKIQDSEITPSPKLQRTSSESSDDFIEVTINPQHIKEDELFPLEIFNSNSDATGNRKEEKVTESKENAFQNALSSEHQDISVVESDQENMESESVSQVELNEFSLEDDSADNEGISELTVEELRDLSCNLQEKEQELVKEKAKHDRNAVNISNQMYSDSQELLRLFGVPFVISPMEAEAQCAFLDASDLTQGTITEDSDVWLFGGQRVYKNFFNQKKHVEFFRDTDIKNHFGLNRENLICLAMLTGSDYTDGIEGVGCVTAMELLSEFPGKNLESLRAFKEWWEKAQKDIRIPQETKIKEKLRHVSVQPGFPSEAVYIAYLNPTVDESKEKFSWGFPDLDALRDFTEANFGWPRKKADEILLPLLQRMRVRETQTRLDSFFNITLEKTSPRLPSKRLKRALKKISEPKDSVVVEEETPRQKAARILKAEKERSLQNADQKKGNKNSTSRGTKQKTNLRTSSNKKVTLSAAKSKQTLPNTVSLSEESSCSD